MSSKDNIMTLTSRVTALIVAAGGLTGCAFIGSDWQHKETQIGDNAWRLEYSQEYATKENANSVLSVFARNKCPNGWDTVRDYQQKGPGYPIWTWEISCLR